MVGSRPRKGRIFRRNNRVDFPQAACNARHLHDQTGLGQPVPPDKRKGPSGAIQRGLALGRLLFFRPFSGSAALLAIFAAGFGFGRTANQAGEFAERYGGGVFSGFGHGLILDFGGETGGAGLDVVGGYGRPRSKPV